MEPFFFSLALVHMHLPSPFVAFSKGIFRNSRFPSSDQSWPRICRSYGGTNHSSRAELNTETTCTYGSPHRESYEPQQSFHISYTRWSLFSSLSISFACSKLSGASEVGNSVRAAYIRGYRSARASTGKQSFQRYRQLYS